MGSAALTPVVYRDRVDPLSSRPEVLAHYRRMRAISRGHNSAVVDRLPRDALLRHGRRLGLAHGRTFIIDDHDELFYVFDLAVHASMPDRPSEIERYARSAKVAAGSDEARMLDAMRCARFSIVQIVDRHPVAGLIARDTVRGLDLWLMDEGLEQSMTLDGVIATRLYALEEFCMTAGVIVPLDPETLVEAISLVPFLRRKTLDEALSDRRLAEAFYRVALFEGIAARTSYRDVPLSDEAALAAG